MAADSDEYDPSAFPASYAAVYCPVDGCDADAPFVDGSALVAHVCTAHDLPIRSPAGVVPIIDRYLRAALPALRAMPGDATGAEYAAWATADDAMRQRLQDERLEEILAMQAEERAVAHRRGRDCLFCAEYCGDKPALFAHMFAAHGFNIGRLDNLVMVDAFLDRLETVLVRERACIYCGGRFPNAQTLRKHMKNKGHYRVHAQNHAYDRHYVVNYMRSGRLHAESADEAEGARRTAWTPGANDDDGCFEDLTERVDMRATCLLCACIADTPDACVAHMATAHGLDLDACIKRHALDDYDAIRAVNYMRTCALEGRCPYCAPPPPEPETRAFEPPSGDWDVTGAESFDEGNCEGVSCETAETRPECDEGDYEGVPCKTADTTPECDEGNRAAEHVCAAHLLVGDLPPEAYWRGHTRWLFPVFEDDPLLSRLTSDS